MLKGKGLLGYTNLFSQIDYEKNDKKLRNSLCKYIFKKVKMREIYCIECKNYK